MKKAMQRLSAIAFVAPVIYGSIQISCVDDEDVELDQVEQESLGSAPLPPITPSYTNKCYGACGAGCDRCLRAGNVYVCESHQACWHHDKCYRENNDLIGRRACDLECLVLYSSSICLSGLVGSGAGRICFDANSTAHLGTIVACPGTGGGSGSGSGSAK